ncbi:hypothetical protein BHE74_00019796 [Ensete ventricosum]|nr:hypothetical protein BHE74_00019796 [Ensete ventricosum]
MLVTARDKGWQSEGEENLEEGVVGPHVVNDLKQRLQTTMHFGKKGWGSHEVTVDTGRGMGDAGPCNNAAECTLQTTA